MRHIGRVSTLISFALKHDLLEETHLRAVSPHQPNLRVAWVFSRFMQPWKGGAPAATNSIMNIFCHALTDLGPEVTNRFLQDRYTFGQYLKIMLTTARRYPGVFPLTARVLGAKGLLKWGSDLAAFALDDVARSLYRVTGRANWHRLEGLAAKASPAAKLKLMAKRTEWQLIEQ